MKLLLSQFQKSVSETDVRDVKEMREDDSEGQVTHGRTAQPRDLNQTVIVISKFHDT